MRYYGRGYTVFNQGEKGKQILIVRRGWLHLSHLAKSGRAVVDLAGPGSLLGLPEVLTGTRFAVRAQTLEDCELEVAEARAFLQFIEKNPSVAVELLRQLGKHHQRSLHHLYDVAGKVSSERRLLRVLHEIGETCGNPTPEGIRLKLPITTQDLGDRIGCSRQWTSRLLSTLQARGQIRRTNGWITILRLNGDGHDLRSPSSHKR